MRPITVAVACMAAGAAYGWAPPHAGKGFLRHSHVGQARISCLHAARGRGPASKLVHRCLPVMQAATQSNKEAWMKGWRSVEEEVQPYMIPSENIEGSIPSDLVGSLYRNGPGKFELNSNKLQHPLDGDGLVSAFTFAGDGSCCFRTRFVRTESYMRERAALENGYDGLPLLRGFFGSKGKQRDMKNCANTNAVLFGGRLVALYEFEVDPASLYTIGQTRIAKSLPADGSFTARPRFDPANDRLVGFSYNVLGTGEVEFIEYNQAWELASKKSFNAAGHGIFHDFALTRKHYILHQAPTTFNAFKYNLGLGSAIDNVQYVGSKKSTIHIIPRDGAKARSVSVDAGFVCQFVNAYEDKDGVIYVEGIEMERFPFGPGPEDGSWKSTFDFASAIPPAKLVRWKISTAGVEREVVDPAFQGFPTINPYVCSVRHQFAYTAASASGKPAPLSSIVKHARDGGRTSFTLEADQVCSGPIFAPRVGGESEDDGYLLSLVYDGKQDKTYLTIFNALQVERGPVCKIDLKYTPISSSSSLTARRTHVPLGLYGCWAEGIVPSSEDYKKGKLAAAFRENDWNEVKGGLGLL